MDPEVMAGRLIACVRRGDMAAVEDVLATLPLPGYPGLVRALAQAAASAPAVAAPGGTSPALLRIEQARQDLGVSRSRMYVLMNSGEIRTVRIGRRIVRIPRSELDSYIARRLRGDGEALAVRAGCRLILGWAVLPAPGCRAHRANW